VINTLIRTIRLYFIQAWLAYRALSAWSRPMGFLANKFGFSFFSMIFFVYLGKFVGLADPIYIVIGNIFLIPISNGIFGISNTVTDEKRFGTLTYLLGSPAPRGPIFFGRALFPTIDSFLTVTVYLLVAIGVFHIDVSSTNWGLVIFCLIMTAMTTSGIGFMMGSLTLVLRDGWVYSSTMSLVMFVFVGANIPVNALPTLFQKISYALPMTRGILASRAVLAGANWAEIASLAYGEIAIGTLYIFIGYSMFNYLERKSMVSGALDSL
jgi:ABC-2 type transport system permease protein